MLSLSNSRRQEVTGNCSLESDLHAIDHVERRLQVKRSL